MSSTFAAILLAFFFLSPQAKEPQSLIATTQDPRFHAIVEKQFLAYEASLASHCKDIHADWTRAAVYMYGTVELDKDGYPFKATWAEQVPGIACGEPRRFRAMVLVRDGKLDTARMLPGDSQTSGQLEADVRTPLVSAAQGFDHSIKPNCAIDVLDTHMLGDAVPPAVWRELWLVDICGRHLNIPITFIPDAKGPGTSFSISSSNITRAP